MQDKMTGNQVSWVTLMRILKVLPLLGRTNGASAREISDTLGLNQCRDVERTLLPALERIGVMVDDLDAGKSGIAHRFRLKDHRVRPVKVGFPCSDLEPQEVLVLRWMLRGGGILGEVPGTTELLAALRTKLARLVPDESLLADPGPGSDMARGLDSIFANVVRGGKDYSGEAGRFIIPLAEAIQEQRVCTLTYQAPAGEAKTWDMWPLCLAENKGALYVISLSDKYRNRYLPLAVDRIQELSATDRTYEWPGDFDPRKWLDSAFDMHFDDPREYRIRFDAEAAPYIRERRWAAEQSLEDCGDGSLILTLHTRGYPDILRWVLGHGRHARVLEPRELADDVRKEALAMAGDVPENQ